MKVRTLNVEGALEFTPPIHTDNRGRFVSPFQGPAFEGATGFAMFPVAQTSLSVSNRGVLRGVHFTTAPPGMAKYAYCIRGAALDIVVDIRVGSPTFGAWDTVQLDERDVRAVYLPVGVGHAFLALEDDTVISYLLSASYVAENEQAISPLDPELGLSLPAGVEFILSERDRAAVTLEEAGGRGMLPRYDRCRRLDDELRRSVTQPLRIG